MESALLSIPITTHFPNYSAGEILMTSLLESLRTRFDYLLHSLLFINATVLDPTVKLIFTRYQRPENLVFGFSYDYTKTTAFKYISDQCDFSDLEVHQPNINSSISSESVVSVSLSELPRKTHVMKCFKGNSKTFQKPVKSCF